MTRFGCRSKFQQPNSTRRNSPVLLCFLSDTPSGGENYSTPQGKQYTTQQVFIAGVLQLISLSVSLQLLISLPAQLFKVQPSQTAYFLYLAYLAFFAVGTLRRIVAARVGLSSVQTDQQRKTISGRLAQLFFIIFMPLIHWLPPYLRSKGLCSAKLTCEAAVSCVLLLGAIVLNGIAARRLGKAYDRLVPPEKIVQSPPYNVIRHPVYLSYLLLFSGYAVCYGAWACVALVWAVGLAYYSYRIGLEEAMLLEAFPEEYGEYCKRVRWRLVPSIY